MRPPASPPGRAEDGQWASGDSPFVPRPWAQLADAVLARELARRDLGGGAGQLVPTTPPPKGGSQLGTGPAAGGEIGYHDKQVEAASQAFRDHLAEPSLLSSLRLLAGMDEEDLEVLAVLLAIELSPARQRAVARLQANDGATQPTLATLAAFFPPPHRGARAVSGSSALASAAFVETSGAGPWGARTVALAPAVVWAFTGDGSPDPDLPASAYYLPAAESFTGGGGLLLVSGADRQSRLDAVAPELPVMGLLVSPVPEDQAGWRALVREATLQGAGAVIETDQPLSPAAVREVDRAAHLWWAVSSPSELPLESLPRRPWRELRLEPAAAPPEEWQKALGQLPPEGARLNREQLRLLALAANGLGCGPQQAISRVVAPHLGALTVRVKPERSWDDLVLAPEDMEGVRELVERYRHRNLVYGPWGYRPLPSAGVVGLFSGPSGTGKTLAAEVVANSLGCDLFKLDLSSVVSKYIGETEKNLEAVFQAAETGEAVLFFDEADALFGKRSEVRDAHDRYANVEVAYLLQRLERHDGLVLLATNLAQNIDPAFERRVHVRVAFRTPQVPERTVLWSKAFPPSTPTGDLDMAWLAKWELTGGNIHNIALSAAFHAAAGGRPVTMEGIAFAMWKELQKGGRLVAAEDLAPYNCWDGWRAGPGRPAP